MISAKFTAHTNSFSAGISCKKIQNDDNSKMTSIVTNLKVELNSLFTFFPLGPVWFLPLFLHEILLIHRSSLGFDMIALDSGNLATKLTFFQLRVARVGPGL